MTGRLSHLTGYTICVLVGEDIYSVNTNFDRCNYYLFDMITIVGIFE